MLMKSEGTAMIQDSEYVRDKIMGTDSVLISK